MIVVDSWGLLGIAGFVGDLLVICWWFVGGLWVVCGWFVGGLWVVCGWLVGWLVGWW